MQMNPLSCKHNLIMMFRILNPNQLLGAIQVLRNAVGVGGGGVNFSRKKRYEGVRFNVISVTREWVGVQFLGKKALSNT